MRMTLRALAALLGYPSADLQTHADEIRAALAAEAALSDDERQRLEPLIHAFKTEDLLDLQADYSELFDRSRALSLHLFEHVHGDSRERGQAMIDLGRQYIDCGLLLESPELPDYVPVFLEFASCLEAAEAREMLGQPAHVFAALDERLEQRGSAYAAVFHAIRALAGTEPDRDARAELEARTPSDDPSRIDAEWEEPPVTFASHEMGGPTGMVARIRATGKAQTAARQREEGQ